MTEDTEKEIIKFLKSYYGSLYYCIGSESSSSTSPVSAFQRQIFKPRSQTLDLSGSRFRADLSTSSILTRTLFSDNMAWLTFLRQQNVKMANFICESMGSQSWMWLTRLYFTTTKNQQKRHGFPCCLTTGGITNMNYYSRTIISQSAVIYFQNHHLTLIMYTCGQVSDLGILKKKLHPCK